LADSVRSAGVKVAHDNFFDTLRIELKDPDATLARAAKAGMNLRWLDGDAIGISLDETTNETDLRNLCALFGNTGLEPVRPADLQSAENPEEEAGLNPADRTGCKPVFR
jgi:glycine dehydrogenase